MAFEARRGLMFDICRTCKGMWFDRGELGRQINRPTDLPDEAYSLSRQKETTLPCPKCKDSALVQIPYAPAVDTTVDLCLHCRGLWVDGGELRVIAASARKASVNQGRETRPGASKTWIGNVTLTEIIYILIIVVLLIGAQEAFRAYLPLSSAEFRLPQLAIFVFFTLFSAIVFSCLMKKALSRKVRWPMFYWAVAGLSLGAIFFLTLNAKLDFSEPIFVDCPVEYFTEGRKPASFRSRPSSRRKIPYAILADQSHALSPHDTYWLPLMRKERIKFNPPPTVRVYFKEGLFGMAWLRSYEFK